MKPVPRTTDQPWIASYPAALHWDSPIALRPVQSLLDDAVARWPDRTAIDFMGRLISYRELGDRVARAAKGLQQLGEIGRAHV